jgi:surface antigen
VRRVIDLGVLGATRASWKAALLAAAALPALAGCGVTMPFERAPAAASDAAIVTGSTPPRPQPALPPGQVSPFSPRLDQEDWRRAKAALATALDPQGNSAAVRWENAVSGHKGSFAPAGDPYLVKDEICRGFVAVVTIEDAEQNWHGAACRLSPTDWAIRDVKSGKRSG